MTEKGILMKDSLIKEFTAEMGKRGYECDVYLEQGMVKFTYDNHTFYFKNTRDWKTDEDHQWYFTVQEENNYNSLNTFHFPPMEHYGQEKMDILCDHIINLCKETVDKITDEERTMNLMRDSLVKELTEEMTNRKHICKYLSDDNQFCLTIDGIDYGMYVRGWHTDYNGKWVMTLVEEYGEIIGKFPISPHEVYGKRYMSWFCGNIEKACKSIIETDNEEDDDQTIYVVTEMYDWHNNTPSYCTNAFTDKDLAKRYVKRRVGEIAQEVYDQVGLEWNERYIKTDSLEVFREQWEGSICLSDDNDYVHLYLEKDKLHTTLDFD